MKTIDILVVLEDVNKSEEELRERFEQVYDRVKQKANCEKFAFTMSMAGNPSVTMFYDPVNDIEKKTVKLIRRMAKLLPRLADIVNELVNIDAVIFEDGLSKNYEAVAVCRICELYSIPAYVDGAALTVNKRNTPPQDLLGTVF